MAFPTTSVLDNFNRANTGPPPSASWSALGASGAAGNTLQVISNQCGETGTPGSAYWNPSVFGPDCEVYATLAVTASAQSWLFARIANPGSGTVDGYLLFWGFGDTYAYRVDNDTYTQLGPNFATSLAAGDKLGIEIVGSTLTYYVNNTGSWVASTTRSDSTYSAAGYIGIATDSTPTRFDDFGGGSIGGAVDTGLMWIRA